MTSNPILDLIDAALADSALSVDAMRWRPAEDTPTALLLQADGTLHPVDLPHDPEGHLPVMYKAIGCSSVDVVSLARDLDMWIDDEGLYRYSVNAHATRLARTFGFVWQSYHGPVLLTGGADRHGETLPLTPARARAIRDVFDPR